MQIEKSFGGNICYTSRGSSACKAEWSYKLSLRGQAGTDSGTPNFIFHLRMMCWLAQTSQSFAAGETGSGELIEEGLEGGLMGVGSLSSWLERLILRGCKEGGHAKSYNKSYILCNRERPFHSWKVAENTQTMGAKNPRSQVFSMFLSLPLTVRWEWRGYQIGYQQPSVSSLLSRTKLTSQCGLHDSCKSNGYINFLRGGVERRKWNVRDAFAVRKT